MRKLLRALGWLLLLAAMVLSGLYWWLLGDLPAPDEIANRLRLPSVRITDRHGRLLYDVVDAHSGRHVNLPLDQIPLPLQQATIATEDRNFYTNPGVDVEGIARAFWINVRGGEVLAGGSTITQQVARNLLLDEEEQAQRSVRRKLRESWLAWRVARTFEKDAILEMYLNQIYYGGLAYGVEAAAQTYFGKPAADLTLAESALIAGIPQAPALYNPFVDPQAAEARQAVVLGLMLKEGFITRAEHDLALREPLQYAATPYPILAPHFVMRVQAGLDDLFTPAQLYASGGLTVRTTLDLDWQTHAEKILTTQIEKLNNPRDRGYSHNANNAALVALDPHTGEILALVGSPDYFDDSIAGAINMALRPRQPGSALKPFVYATAMDPSRPRPWTAATLLLDVRTAFTTRKGETYVPVNFSRTENGPVLLRQALASSLNIPAVLALEEIGVETMLETAADLGIHTLGVPEDYDLSFALGGGAVRLLDLTAAYGALANGGYRVAPRYILDVTAVNGDVVYTAEPPELTRVMDERVAWLISDILSDDGARRLSFKPNSLLKIDRTAAVKTGTTNDFHDNWTVGYTPELVTGVWVGNADNTPMIDVTGLSGAGPIWHNFMRTVLAGRPDQAFVRPPDLVKLEVCALSGLLPTEACPFRHNEWFIAGTQPVDEDTFYKKVILDARTQLPADETTPRAARTETLVLDLPPQAHGWARANGILLLDDLLMAQAKAEQALSSSGSPLRVITPDPNLVYRLSPELPLEAQKIRLEAISATAVAEVSFWIDGRLVEAVAVPPYEAWWALSPGPHQVWVEARDAAGNRFVSQPVNFRVKTADEE